MTPERGTEVRLRSSGAKYRVEAMIGRGGQGAVFRVAAGDGSAALALKWYRKAAGTRAQHARLEQLLSVPRPSAEFLWPIEFATQQGTNGWGYVMPLGRPAIVPLSRVVKGEVSMRLRTLVESATQVAQAFQRLHGQGLCYADVSLNNVLVHPGDGRVQICDNDNVTIDGRRSDVLGTPYFIAPEIVRRESNPSITSDRHSLAVMLFWLLLRNHPLLGARDHARRVLGESDLTDLLGDRPVFLFDPEDETNRPVSGVQDNPRLLWPTLPGAIRSLFLRAFTRGLSDPAHGRVTEAEWVDVLLRLRGLVRQCPACNTEQFADDEQPLGTCVEELCRQPLDQPVLLHGRPRRPVLLEEGKELLRSDLSGRLEAADRTVADVVRHPRTHGLALRNLSDGDWSLLRDDRRPAVRPGDAVLLRNDTRLKIEDVTLRATAQTD